MSRPSLSLILNELLIPSLIHDCISLLKTRSASRLYQRYSSHSWGIYLEFIDKYGLL
jgi:hypothetical protein